MHLVVALSKRDFDRLLAAGTQADMRKATLYRFESAQAPRTDDNVLLEAYIAQPPVAADLSALADHGITLTPDGTRRVLAAADEWMLTHDPRRERTVQPTTLPRSRFWAATAAVLATIVFLGLGVAHPGFWGLALLMAVISVILVLRAVRRASGQPTPPAVTLRSEGPRIRTRLVPKEPLTVGTGP